MAAADEAMVDADKPAEVAKVEEPVDVATLVRFDVASGPGLFCLAVRRRADAPGGCAQLKRTAALLEKSVTTKETRFAARALRQARCHSLLVCPATPSAAARTPRRCAPPRTRGPPDSAPACRPPRAVRPIPALTRRHAPQTSALRKRFDNDSVTAFLKARAAPPRAASQRATRAAPGRCCAQRAGCRCWRAARARNPKRA